MAKWPAVVGALVTLLPTLPGWEAVAVFDGQPLTDEIPDYYATIAWTDSGHDQAGTYTQATDPDGFQIQETGQVHCELCVVVGGATPAYVRNAVFPLLDTLEAALNANQTLGGVLSANATIDLSADITGLHNPKGAAQSLNFTVNYFTVT